MTPLHQSETEAEDHEPEVVWALERELRDCEPVIAFVLPGEPVSKARARFTGRGSSTRAYTPEKTRAAEALVASHAYAAGAGRPDPTSCFGLLAVFFAATWQRRDADNMLKLVSDGLTGVVWADDSQVTEMSARLHRGVSDPRTHVLVYRTSMQAPPTRPCEGCGEPIRQFKSTPGRFCSRACISAAAASKRESVTCRTCGRTFKLSRKQANRVYCDTTCRRADPSPRVRGPVERAEPYQRPAPQVHNAAGYKNGCRCQECTAAHAAADRARRVAP